MNDSALKSAIQGRYAAAICIILFGLLQALGVVFPEELQGEIIQFTEKFLLLWALGTSIWSRIKKRVG